jgi:hypothetical protein
VALGQKKRYREAVKDLDEVLALLPEAARPTLAMVRATTLVRAGDHAAATAAARRLVDREGVPGTLVYAAAAVHAVASVEVGKDKALAQAERERLAERYAVAAVALLRGLVQAGFRDAEHLRRNPDLEPLRGRKDFQKLLRELGKRGGAAP